ncbi:MAG: hypothetical protein M3Y45_00850 [Actinomycetota bacterium]|nr:hypothetical protein [Actinomycetota bacterium]
MCDLGRRRFGLALLVVVLALGVGGCGGDSDPEAVDVEPASSPASRLKVMEPIVGCTYDYQPMRGPRAMARVSDLVVRGTIGEPRPGLVAIRSDGCAFPPPRREAKLASFAGREVVAYLVRKADGITGYPGRVRYAEGAPRPRFQEASLEGFLVELASGKGVRNLSLDERFPGSELTDFYPGREKFPRVKRP